MNISANTSGEPSVTGHIATHTGRVRDHNEDAFLHDADLGLWLVADGMGGHAAGEVASRIAVETVQAEVAAGRPLAAALERAHIAVIKAMTGQPERKGMGTTMVAVQIQGRRFELAWIGDSRAYLYDADARGLERLTRDHNLFEKLRREQGLGAEEAAAYSQSKSLTRAIGVRQEPAPGAEWVDGELRSGQCLLLCSDGLTDELDDPAIEHILKKASNPERISEDLVQAALRAGGRDNITVAVIQSAAARK